MPNFGQQQAMLEFKMKVLFKLFLIYVNNRKKCLCYYINNLHFEFDELINWGIYPIGRGNLDLLYKY